MERQPVYILELKLNDVINAVTEVLQKYGYSLNVCSVVCWKHVNDDNICGSVELLREGSSYVVIFGRNRHCKVLQIYVDGMVIIRCGCSVSFENVNAYRDELNMLAEVASAVNSRIKEK